MPRAKQPNLLTKFVWLGQGTFAGFVADPVAPHLRFTVELLIDGMVIATAHSSQFVSEFVDEQIGDGSYGFLFSVPEALISNSNQAKVRLANTDTAIGVPIELTESVDRDISLGRPVSLRWLGGVRFAGCLEDRDEVPPELNVIVDGQAVQQVKQLGWGQSDASPDRAGRTFDFHIPDRFADGCVHRISIRGSAGETLSRDELPFVAFYDGLAATLGALGTIDSERFRGELFDRLLPMSLPMTDYDRWRERFPISEGPSSSLQCAVLLVGRDPTDASLESLERQTHSHWVAACLETEEVPTCFKPSLAKTFLRDDAHSSDLVIFAMAGVAFASNALQRFAEAFDAFPDAIAVYSDIDVLANDGRSWPLAFPTFDYERLLEQGYCAHLFAVRRNIADELLKVGPSTLYRLFNALFDDGLARLHQIVHLPGSTAVLPPFDRGAASKQLSGATLQHLRARDEEATVENSKAGILPATRICRNAAKGSTTIIIPTRDRVELLGTCLDSIRPAVEAQNADIVIVDNDSSDPATLDYLSQAKQNGFRVVRVAGPFNFARLNNVAVATLKTDNILLLNNDIEAQDDRWLDELLSRLAEPDVGAVGARLTWPNGVVQHGGVVLGPNFDAAHAFNDRQIGDFGYTDLLGVAHECSAVTAACMLTRRKDYLAVGGMDEVVFSIAYNDVDYCLKLRAMGKRIVFTPHATLTHRESISRGRDRTKDTAGRFHRERDRFRAKWGTVVADDPYYNPVLSLDAYPYSALAWPPRDRSARIQCPSGPAELLPGL